MLAHLGVQNLSPFLELLLVDFAARKALPENVAARMWQRVPWLRYHTRLLRKEKYHSMRTLMVALATLLLLTGTASATNPRCNDYQTSDACTAAKYCVWNTKARGHIGFCELDRAAIRAIP
jgi:hypothetical protein